jgi:hypothetical protein
MAVQRLEYFWKHSPDTPPTVVEPRDLSQTERLNVACTQTGLPPSKQRAVVNEWCDVLPTLQHVRLLWLSSKVPQRLFEAACRMPHLEGLWIKWSAVESIESLSALEGLRYFHLGSSTRLTSIEPLRGCGALQWLGLENLSRIHDLAPIATLTALEGLSLEGSMWNTWKVASLSPVGALTGLRYLSIANLRTDDRTLGPLFSLQQLETFHAAQWWKAEELDELRRRNRGLSTALS